MLLTSISLPFAFTVSGDREQARAHTAQWLATYNLCDRSDRAAGSTACDLAEMAAYIFPEANGSDLQLGFDLIGWLYFFDDLLSGPGAEHPRDAAALVSEFTAVIRGSAQPRENRRGVAALMDLWTRQKEGMSPSWQARAAYNWELYLCSHPQEAIKRRRGVGTDQDLYLEERYGASGSELVLDFAERLNRNEVAPVAFHCLPLRRMRRITVDIANLCNDIHSADREDALGELNNLVLMVQRDQDLTRVGAVENVRRMIWSRVEEFQRLKSEACTACELMGLTQLQRDAVDRYIRSMEFFIRGYDEWGRTSARYTDSSFIPPWAKIQSASTATP